MPYQIITPPDAGALPVSLDALKEHLNITVTDTKYDAIITLYLQSAVEEFEARTGRNLITQTVQETFDYFPCGDFKLCRAPYADIGSFSFIDLDGNTSNITDDVYYIRQSKHDTIFSLKSGASWPVNLSNDLGQLQITYDVGYGQDDESIPAGIKHALMMLVADSFVYKEDTVALPGVVSVVVTWHSAKLMEKYKTNYSPNLSMYKNYRHQRW